MNLEFRIRGNRRRYALDVENIRREYRGHVLARFDLDAIGYFSIPDCLCIRRNDDILFVRAADYAAPDGPQAFHRYIYFEPPFDRELAICTHRQ